MGTNSQRMATAPKTSAVPIQPMMPVICFMMLSPATGVVLVEIEELNELEIPEWLGMLLNYAYHAACALFWRQLALKRADRLLGRVAEPSSQRVR